jgi:uncharacterized membrane protein
MGGKFKMFFLLCLAVGFFLGSHVLAAPRTNITDWYIQNFISTITVNKDSSLEIVEKITADCGDLPGKHGIFRVLPERINLTDGSKIETPVELVAITDFSGKPIKYSQSRNTFDKTVTWKIGDPDVTVRGVNEYQIHYRVKNAIRFGDPGFDEFYWNLNGNFWDIEMDQFRSEIIFPEEVSEDNAEVEYYTGYLGEQGKELAEYAWRGNILVVSSKQTLLKGQGITVSVAAPKGIFQPYVPTFWEKYGDYLWLALPFLVLMIAIRFWKKYGDDPAMDQAVVAEYEVPEKLSPIELGMLMTNGRFKNEFITAEIINLAVKGLITIKETKEKILIFNSNDHQFTKNSKPEVEKELTDFQREILDKIFAGGNEVKLSSLKNNFYTIINNVKKKTISSLADKNLIAKSGLSYQVLFLVIGIIFMIFSFLSLGFNIFMAIGVFFSGLILIIFSFFMPKRTELGVKTNHQIKGFKLFMKTVDKDRAAFYEKENIFEKFLPYAIIFGITDQWIKRMKEVYGEEYFNSHAPAWYVSSNFASFDADGFSNAMSGLSSGIAANTSSPSGSGGSGGSGGGGGGGGGGGW